ncbi:single-stranded DNA-binding protein [Georgenia muralis]|uniref:Single-stranded DNA-binding protein n=1 Tax=Georgenia muralis TaxID=154117 RepID=A0A3N4ZQ97_9MICO|nr:single-stranded DNA-binding protein [Georgenia muralis]RPF27722.1 single stranded DNA-binding protein [Georgenia muralis]
MKDNADITVLGRLGSEPVLRTSAAGRPWVSFRVVANSRRREEDGQYRDVASYWFTVKAWDDLARNAGFSLHKGMSVVVQGKLSVETWTGEDGQKFDHVLKADAIAVELGLGMVNFVRTAPPRVTSDDAAGAGTVTGPDGSRWESVDLPEGETEVVGDRADDVPEDVADDSPEYGPEDDPDGDDDHLGLSAAVAAR